MSPRAAPVGLIPAAGRATRLGRLPCSKELLPVGFRETERGSAPKVACHYLLERLRAAGIRRAYIVLREDKWDIPRYLGSGEMVDMSLAYLSLSASRSVPETLDRAYPFVAESLVALGYPDTIFHPQEAFCEIIERQAATAADLVLGLFPAEECWRTDMVDLDPDGRVREIHIRPRTSELRFNWLIAVWTPAFGRFLHQAVACWPPSQGEQQLGCVMQDALRSGLEVQGVAFAEGWYRDIGLPGDLESLLGTGARR